MHSTASPACTALYHISPHKTAIKLTCWALIRPYDNLMQLCHTSTAQHSTEQNRTARPSTSHHSTAQHCVTRHMSLPMDVDRHHHLNGTAVKNLDPADTPRRECTSGRHACACQLLNAAHCLIKHFNLADTPCRACTSEHHVRLPAACCIINHVVSISKTHIPSTQLTA